MTALNVFSKNALVVIVATLNAVKVIVENAQDVNVKAVCVKNVQIVNIIAVISKKMKLISANVEKVQMNIVMITME